MIELRVIGPADFQAVLDLRVADEQKGFVANNTYSLAQSKIFPELSPWAVYADATLVGFVLYGIDKDDGQYWIARLMIDQRYQRQGYGRQALEEVLRRLTAEADCHQVYLSIEPENTVARKLYEKLGFKADGRIIENEVVMCLELPAS